MKIIINDNTIDLDCVERIGSNAKYNIGFGFTIYFTSRSDLNIMSKKLGSVEDFNKEKDRLISLYAGKANLDEYTDIPTFNF